MGTLVVGMPRLNARVALKVGCPYCWLSKYGVGNSDAVFGVCARCPEPVNEPIPYCAAPVVTP